MLELGVEGVAVIVMEGPLPLSLSSWRRWSWGSSLWGGCRPRRRRCCAGWGAVVVVAALLVVVAVDADAGGVVVVVVERRWVGWPLS